MDKKDSLKGKVATGGRLNAASALGVRTTNLTLANSPRTITFGKTTKLSGKLSSEGEPLGSRTVILQRRPTGASSFTKVGQTTTAADGTYSLSSVKPDENTNYRAVFSGNTSDKLASTQSTYSQALVRVRVGLSTSSTKLKLGRARTISGSVAPKHGGSVTVTIKRNGSVVARKKDALNSYSRYSIRYKPSRPGTYAFTATYSKHGDHLGNRGPQRSFWVVR